MTRPLKPCGTRAAYRRHLAHGEDPDLACRVANAAATDRLRAGEGPRPTVIQHARRVAYDPAVDVLELLRLLAELFPFLNFTQNGLNNG